MNLVITVIQVLCSLVLVAIVMLQSGKSAGLSGAISVSYTHLTLPTSITV